MAVTRIKNNQITDSTIVANTKLQNYTVTSTLLANNLTYGSDLTVTGNLTVQGQTTTIDTNVTTIEDPVILLASTQTGSPTVDIGFIGERGTSDNIAFVWDESASEFVTAFTSTGETNTTITISSYSNFHTNDANIGGNIVINGTTSLVGNLTGNLSVTGNIAGGNILTDGLIDVTGNVTGGNINTAGQVVATGNITGGNLVTSALVSAATVTASGNVTGGNLITGGVADVTGNVTGGNLVTGGVADVTGNVTGGNLITGGVADVTGNVTGGNIVTVGLGSFGTTVTATGNITGGNLSTTGTATATGNITGGNLITSGLISVTGNVDGTGAVFSGNVTADTFIGNISGNIDAGGANTNIQFNDDNILNGSAAFTFDKTSNAVTASGNITGGNLVTGGVVDATGNVTGGNLITAGVADVTGNIAGGNLNTGGKVVATGNLETGANLVVSGYASVTGNVTGGNLITAGVADVTGNVTGGNVTTAGKANIGTLEVTGTSTVTGNITGGNLITAGVADVTGNVTGGNLVTVGLTNTGTLQVSGNAIVDGNLTVNGNLSYINIDDLRVQDPIIILGTGPNGAPLTTNDGLDRGVYMEYYTTGLGNAFMGWDNSTGNMVIAHDVDFTANDVVGVNTYGTLQAGNLYVESTVSVGNVTGGNLNTAGQVLATGNITGGNLITSGTFESASISATGNITGGNINTSGKVVATGNLETGANVVSSGYAAITGNVTGGNLVTGGAVDATGNVTGGNLVTGGAVDATGNVTGGNLITSGLTTTNTLAVSSTSTFTGNITSAFNVTGNITGGNLLTPGIISATSNITGGNIVTGGVVTATGNIGGGNLSATGQVTATTGWFTGNVDVLGNLNATIGVVYANSGIFYGNSVTGNNAAFAGIPGFTQLGSNVVMQFAGNVNSYSQLNFQNINNGNMASTDYIATADNGDDSNYYVNMGINSSTFDDPANYPGFGPNDAYVHNHGGNLILNPETAGKAINFMVGGTDTTDIIGYVNANGLSVTGTISATGNITGGNLITSGTFESASISATGNITGGNLITAGLVSAGTTITATGNVSGGNVTTAGQVVATGNVNGGNVVATALVTGANVTATANVSGANVVGTTAVIGGNIVITGDDITDTNGRVNFNTAGADVDFAVNGDTVANVFYVDAGTGTASFGSETQTTDALVAFNTTSSIVVPVGNIGSRPGTGVTGMLRFNTTNNNMEVYDNTQWTAVGVPSFTVIINDSFAGDGSTVAFTLSESASTDSCIVSINGVVQIPTTAYSVSGTTLTFTEAPLTGDAIDVRILTTTTTVTEISNSSGNAVVATLDTAKTVQITGDLVPVANLTANLGSPTNYWKTLYVGGNTIYLGNLQLKNDNGTMAFYESDGTTPAPISSGSVDTSLISSGTSSVAVIASGGNVRTNIAGATVQTISTTGVAITGDLSVTGNATLSGNILGDRIQNGTTQIDIQTQDGNANITVAGTANVAVFSSGGANITGTLGVSGNITGGNLSGTNIVGTLTTAAQTNITSVGTLGSLAVTANVTAGNLSVGTGTISGGNIVNTNANGVGNIGSSTTYFNTVFAKATSAQYADLAEKYVADAEYPAGTVVVFGGDKEVTVTSVDADRAVAGVVSTNPSYIMNGGLEAEFVATVALTGRVPCRVTGTVRKGDLMVSAGYGQARAEQDPRVGTVIGKALENFEGTEGVIEVVVGRF